MNTPPRSLISDDESGLDHDYEMWLEKLAPSQYHHNRTGEVMPMPISSKVYREIERPAHAIVTKLLQASFVRRTVDPFALTTCSERIEPSEPTRIRRAHD